MVDPTRVVRLPKGKQILQPLFVSPLRSLTSAVPTQSPLQFSVRGNRLNRIQQSYSTLQKPTLPSAYNWEASLWHTHHR